MRIAAWNPEENAVALLGVNALPFGATGSVTSFLRVAMALWFLGLHCLDLVWTCVFDDYTLLSQDASLASASFAAESLFKLLGVQYAPEGSKNTEFSKGVKTLGAFLNLDTVKRVRRNLVILTRENTSLARRWILFLQKGKYLPRLRRASGVHFSGSKLLLLEERQIIVCTGWVRFPCVVEEVKDSLQVIIPS